MNRSDRERLFKLTDAEVSTISASLNQKFDEAALEFSKRIAEIANTVSDSNDQTIV